MTRAPGKYAGRAFSFVHGKMSKGLRSKQSLTWRLRTLLLSSKLLLRLGLTRT
jgi:hypothetical protein